MRRILKIMDGWMFTGQTGKKEPVNLPHTWNRFDGQDGGNDYYRGICSYERAFRKPQFEKDERVYLQFQGVNASARVILNGKEICTHDNGYSTFRVDITGELEDDNLLKVEADNGINDRVYPQKADFTFYGGIYRDVEFIIVAEEHFELDYYGGPGIRVDTETEGHRGIIHVETYTNVTDLESSRYTVLVKVFDADGNMVGETEGRTTEQNKAGSRRGHAEKARSFNAVIEVEKAHLWNGVKDPYLYKVQAFLVKAGKELDEVSCKCGIRTFAFDPDKGFFLNGKSYPLRGVAKHQDFKDIGNAVSAEVMEQDMKLIREIGANTIRLAHYQHSQFFYDLCDSYGMVVWAEIPYISSHMPDGRKNTFLQMRELIIQNYNHPSIVTWGISNEITILDRHRKDMLDNHKKLQKLCKELDPTRPTTLACFALCSPFHPVTGITDLVAWNLYLGWYVPGLKLNDWFMEFYHKKFPKRCLGYSEYGAEGMPNLHSQSPRRGDHTEEYQARYHEYMLKCIDRHPFLWATYVWNMFDFAADAREQGGEPGMNHKGLVTFDRKIKKDSFYIYKAWWSEEAFIHLCGKRYKYRAEKYSDVTVYSNQKEVSLYNNGKLVQIKKGKHAFHFKVELEKENHLEARAGALSDSAVIYKTDKARPEYKVKKGRSQNWV